MFANIMKIVVGSVAGMSASYVVENALSTMVPPAVTTFKKVMTVVGTFVVSGVVYDAASRWAKNTIDDMTKKEVKTEVKTEAKVEVI